MADGRTNKITLSGGEYKKKTAMKKRIEATEPSRECREYVGFMRGSPADGRSQEEEKGGRGCREEGREETRLEVGGWHRRGVILARFQLCVCVCVSVCLVGGRATGTWHQLGGIRWRSA